MAYFSNLGFGISDFRFSFFFRVFQLRILSIKVLVSFDYAYLLMDLPFGSFDSSFWPVLCADELLILSFDFVAFSDLFFVRI
uniref:Uncharacterized protein n=1 Tax=Rhizophora mucronata TaxID=61149 RepID=A0A2P2MET9_RHIMU